jgi:hypothetical protein
MSPSSNFKPIRNSSTIPRSPNLTEGRKKLLPIMKISPSCFTHQFEVYSEEEEQAFSNALLPRISISLALFILIRRMLMLMLIMKERACTPCSKCNIVTLAPAPASQAISQMLHECNIVTNCNKLQHSLFLALPHNYSGKVEKISALIYVIIPMNTRSYYHRRLLSCVGST